MTIETEMFYRNVAVDVIRDLKEQAGATFPDEDDAIEIVERCVKYWSEPDEEETPHWDTPGGF